MDDSNAPYNRRVLALVHHLGFGLPRRCLRARNPRAARAVRERGNLVVEIGCGSGLLTRHLIEDGHRVVATDASPAMLDIARKVAAGAQDIRRLTLPNDPVPQADAVVRVGHALNYLPDTGAVDRALAAMVGALRPDGVQAIDLRDMEWVEARRDVPNAGRPEATGPS